MKKIRIDVLHLDQVGYGVDGSLTRREWQELCLSKLLLGRQAFNEWQNELHLRRRKNEKQPSFDWVEQYADASKSSITRKWSGSYPAHYVFDISNRVVNNVESHLNLQGYDFRFGAIFNGAVFKGRVSFNDANYSNTLSFCGTLFEEGVSFFAATFEKMIDFHAAVFLKNFSCAQSTFKSGAIFVKAKFSSAADFSNAVFSTAHFDGACFAKRANFSATLPINDNKLKTFGWASFSGVHFKGVVDFSNREFTGGVLFDIHEGTPTQFDEAPLFHNCKLHQGTTFVDAQFSSESVKKKTAALAYNTLRLAMSQKQSTHEEQRFLRLEFDAEKEKSQGFTAFLYRVYKKLSDYGFSVLRPFVWLVTLPLAFAILIYAFFASDCFDLANAGCKLNSDVFFQVVEYSFRSSLPPLGLDKTIEQMHIKLFGGLPPLVSFLLTITVSFQKLLALLGWFLVALALRNRFKMK